MVFENYVMDVFRGVVPAKELTPQVLLGLDRVLGDIGWNPAFSAPRTHHPERPDTRAYSINEGNSIVGLGYYAKEEIRGPFLLVDLWGICKLYYSLHLQVAASTKEQVKELRGKAIKAINDLVSNLNVENTTFDSIMRPGG
ncbi:MAG: hypothetical protein AABX33_03120 [Nanoarchaeota archaeon]